MHKHTRQQRSLIAEAQQWERVLKDAGPEDQAAFAAWIKRSPQHLEAYLLHFAIQTELRQVDRNGEFDVEALLAKASTNVVELTSGMPQTSPAVSSESGRGR